MGVNKLERRVAPMELKIERREAGESPRMVGHAAVFNRQSVDLGGFVEVIKPGAFGPALEVSDTRALWNHNSDLVLGRAKSRTLRLVEDEVGLAVEIDPPKSALSYIEAVERGDVDQMSFAFTVSAGKQTWEELEDGGFLRTIFEFEELFDVSPVTYPAYPDTDVALRRLELVRQHHGVPNTPDFVHEQRRSKGELEAMKLEIDRTLLDIEGRHIVN